MNRILIAILIIVTACVGFYVSTQQKDVFVEPEKTITNTKGGFSDYTARFEIYTNGTKRIFSDSKYHNKSQDVYIENSNPSVVNIKKEGLTWADFFATLPMKLEKDCLTTGTGQVFCSNKDKKLKFYINNLENPNALTTTIYPDDFLKVVYSDE